MSKSTAFALKIWPFVLGAFLVTSLNTVEHRFFPVVRDFHAVSVLKDEKFLSISGYMRKTRNCQFAGISAVGSTTEHDIDLMLSFRDKGKDTATRPEGSQSWGPWLITLPMQPELSEITLTAVHNCHPFWATQTHLITIPLTEVSK